MLDFIHRYEAKIEFSKIGHDFSLDFVKGLCIILVLVNHATDDAFKQETFFYIWGYPAVPLFLLLQVFHIYKKGFNGGRIRWGRIWTRALFPFLLVELLLTAVTIIQDPLAPVKDIFVRSLFWGGMGPGSYYPWIYIQFAILLPLLTPLFRRFSGKSLFILFLVLSIGGEMACSYLHMPEWLYRLLFIRYISLIYLGYLLVVRGIELNLLTISLSIVSLVAVWCFETQNQSVLAPFFYHSNGWKSCHWICYFYIAYPMLYVLCRFFYWLPANSWIENVVCKMGNHSYAIYIFQLFYFVAIAPMVSDGLSLIDAKSVVTFLYLLFTLLFCTFPVLNFVYGRSDRAILKRVAVIVLVLVAAILLIGWKWRPFYQPVPAITPYEVKRHHDDTLRVIMIGDSWVYFHETLRRDSTLELKLKRELGSQRVKLAAKGKGGAVSGEIYERMSAERMWAIEFDLNNCTQSMIEQGADYCIISAGINDARQRRGKPYYVTNYFHIIHLLLSYGIRPVVMEIPDVEVNEAFEGNTFYYRLRSRIAMSYLNTSLYGTNDYRQALKDSLVAHHLMDSIVYIPAASWNPDGWRDKRDIYTDDHFHLNLAGYEILDSTFAAEIVKDYRLRKKR